MRPKLSASLVVAHRVWRDVNLPKAVCEWATVTGYENGREHGLALRVMVPGRGLQDLVVCWAECRNSDQIVVYVGQVGEGFEPNTSIPTDRAYRTAKYFGPSEYRQAADWISAAVATAFKVAAEEAADEAARR